MTSFIIPTRCTIKSVNAALKAAGYGDIEIIYDVYNYHRITVEHQCYDQFDQPYISSQRTRLASARAWAERFADGRFDSGEQ